MTTIYSYFGDKMNLDGRHSHLRRVRAGVMNIVRIAIGVTKIAALRVLASVLGGGPSLGTRLNKIKALTINMNPHLDRLPAIHKQTYNLCRLT